MHEQNKQLESTAAILKALSEASNKAYLRNMGRFSINSTGALGFMIPAIMKLARQVGKSKEIALELWSSLHEALILAKMV